MLFEIVCHNCNKICRDLIPLIKKDSVMDMLCPNCDFVLLSFYDENHPLTVWVRENLN